MSDPRPRHSRISRRLWNDEGFRILSGAQPNGQTLWLRLLTGPELTNIPGIVPAWEAGLAQALRWPLEGFRKAFAEVSAQGMAEADWDAGLVWVPNAIVHNRPESPNVIRSWLPTWDMTPECSLKRKAYSELRAFIEGMGEGFRQAFTEACAEPSSKTMANQEQDQEQDQDQIQDSSASRRPSDERAVSDGRGRRIASDWKPKDETVQWAAQQGVDAMAMTEEFVEYWRSIPGSKGRRADWDLAFKGRVRQMIADGRAPKLSESTGVFSRIEFSAGQRVRVHYRNGSVVKSEPLDESTQTKLPETG